MYLINNVRANPLTDSDTTKSSHGATIYKDEILPIAYLVNAHVFQIFYATLNIPAIDDMADRRVMTYILEIHTTRNTNHADIDDSLCNRQV